MSGRDDDGGQGKKGAVEEAQVLAGQDSLVIGGETLIKLVPMLLLVLVAGAVVGGATCLAAPERVVIPENAVVWRAGYIRLQVDNATVWIPEENAPNIITWALEENAPITILGWGLK